MTGCGDVRDGPGALGGSARPHAQTREAYVSRPALARRPARSPVYWLRGSCGGRRSALSSRVRGVGSGRGGVARVGGGGLLPKNGGYAAGAELTGGGLLVEKVFTRGFDAIEDFIWNGMRRFFPSDRLFACLPRLSAPHHHRVFPLPPTDPSISGPSQSPAPPPLMHLCSTTSARSREK